MHTPFRLLTASLLFALALAARGAAPVPIFDGKSFAGWEGDLKWWRVQDGAIVGGSLERKVPVNHFLATTRDFTNFIFRAQFKLIGTNGFINSGVQIRSQRVPNNTEMAGYQCDIGDPTWWGSIYDESRRNKVMAQSDMKALEPVLKRGDWNRYEIRAEGRRIRTFINGVLAVDYTEQDVKLPQWGKTGLQIHGGGAAEAWFKDVTVEELPPTKESPLKPEDQAKAFELPPGFVVELVASEPDFPKPVTVAWDDAGRMWGVTAVEYPVDANENAAVAEALFKNGGRDKILVWDNPAGPGPHTPRVFADGLAIPLGVLPYRDGAFVQYGTEVLFLRDTDGDGRADKRETILSGFGIQDSHLFPHQFMRASGGWLYLAQGAFNYSKVRTRDGVVLRYDQTKLARFRPDGSAFEILTHGPCNIWGLVIDRYGQTWGQEANDYGYPLYRIEPGVSIPGCGDTKFRPYAPMLPSPAEFRMGGTGLSGLALVEGETAFPADWQDVMLVANPITRAVQAIRIHREGGGHRLEKLADFVTCADEWFRPVAIHFGPDGGLYIVDWYNKIISHNEVPRTHPDRDKSRGRLWRVRHSGQKPLPVQNVARAADADLVKHLFSSNKWEWNAALNQIAERRPAGLSLQLIGLMEFSAAKPVLPRLLWALESLGGADEALLKRLSAHADPNLRREALRIAGAQLPPEKALGVAAPRAADPDHYVRTEVIRVLSGQEAPWKHHILEGAEKRPDRPLSTAAIETLVRMAQPSLPDVNKPGPGYEREFERYLVRAALERQPEALQQFLDAPVAASLPVENRLFAALALPGEEAARRVASALPKLQRVFSDEEFALLLQHPGAPGVSGALAKLAAGQTTAKAIAQAAMRLRTRIDATAVAAPLLSCARTLLAATDQSVDEALKLAAAFKLRDLEPDISRLLDRMATKDAVRVAALKALREIQSGPVELLHRLATDPGASAAVRTEALAALAANRHPEAAPKLLSLWPALAEAQRRPLIEQLASSKAGGETLLAAIRAGNIDAQELPIPALEKMHAALEGNAQMDALWRDVFGRMKRVLRLDGANGDYVSTKLSLDGPFSVECWVKLDANISNHDGILGAAERNDHSLDMNFHASQFRVWVGGGANDIVVAKRKSAPDAWTHYAVTRDATGVFRLYLNGELDATSQRRHTNSFAALDLGRTLPTEGGTAGWLAEFRVWSVARSAEEIMANFDRSFAGEKLPAALAHYHGGEKPWGTLRGKARVEGTLDAPPLLTAAEAASVEVKFSKFRSLADTHGDATRGKELFTTACLVCHQASGQGAGLAPNLDGSAHRGTEGLLRALLTPSAAVESGYRRFRVETKAGEIQEGFLAQRDASGVLLRQPNAEPLKIAAADIKRAGFQNGSLMPEGLLESLEAKQVSDLFAYLRTMK